MEVRLKVRFQLSLACCLDQGRHKTRSHGAAILFLQGRPVSSEDQYTNRKSQHAVRNGQVLTAFQFSSNLFLRCSYISALGFCDIPAAWLLMVKACFPFNKLNWNSGTCSQRLLNNTPIPYSSLCVCFICPFYPSFLSTFLCFFPLFSSLSFSSSSSLLFSLSLFLYSSLSFLFPPPLSYFAVLNLLSESKHGCTFMSAQQQAIIQLFSFQDSQENLMTEPLCHLPEGPWFYKADKEIQNPIQT